MSFGSRLKEARNKAGLNQAELGERIGVTGNSVSNYEKGTSSPNDHVLLKIFDALGVEPNYLFQDSFTVQNKKAPENRELATNISIEESTQLLIELGYIREGEVLSDADLGFLVHIMGLLDTWFSKKA